jgi:hypothetical protein
MEGNQGMHYYAWMEDGEMLADTSEPVCHRSTQVAGKPDYVADVCDRFAGEKAEERAEERTEAPRKSCVIRGYN